MQHLTHRRFNHALTAIVVLLALYIIVLPFTPSLLWWAKHQAPFIARPPTVAAALPTAPIPADNTLALPTIGVQQTIHESPNKSALRLGVWHRPGTGNPADGGNMVLAGHRFTYSDPAVFYNLDKVKVGDSMIVYWQKQRYTYKVERIVTVPPSATYIEAPTDKPTLTVYTCTPVWTSKFRLALIGSLEQSK